MITLLNEYSNIFVWSYADMLRLNIDIIMHRLSLRPEYKLLSRD